MTFQNLRGGQRIKFRMPNGLKIVNGKAVPEYRVRSAKVCPLLVFADHVVVNLGGAHGTPYVVNASNFIEVVS